MDLIFTKQADRWVAEFLAKADFNLHIEGVVEGNVSLFQRGSESGNYAFVKDGTPHPSYANVYDYDSAALVYPKFIKVSCATEPTSGIVTSDGEITEIKAQTKEIEVTSNGTTIVAPDAGFAYLNSVKVKTNVATSGEGGGSDWHYYDYAVVDSMVGNLPTAIIAYMQIAKENNGIKTPWLVIDSPQAFAVDFSAKVSVAVFIPEENKVEERLGTILEALQEIEIWSDGYKLRDIPEITEEEFYNINNVG